MSMKDKKWNLKRRIVAGFLALIIVISAVITVLFLHTKQTMLAEYEKRFMSSVEGISENIDGLVKEIYNVSDNLAVNTRIDDFLDREYDGETGNYMKKADTMRLYSQMVSSYYILRRSQKISAIYTYKGVLFNFKDVNRNGEEVTDRLDELGVNNKEHLMRFYWYPLQDNFMVSEPSGELPKGQNDFGSQTGLFCLESGLCMYTYFCTGGTGAL